MTEPTTVPAGIAAPQVDFTPAADPFTQQLVAENARLKEERDQLALINARLADRLNTLRAGVVALAEKTRGAKGGK